MPVALEGDLAILGVSEIRIARQVIAAGNTAAVVRARTRGLQHIRHVKAATVARTRVTRVADLRRRTGGARHLQTRRSDGFRTQGPLFANEWPRMVLGMPLCAGQAALKS